MTANTDTGTANIDQAGSAGTPTLGDFTGSHVYTAPGAYTVKVTINDNEGAANSTTSQTFVATVVVPVVQAVPTQTVDEGSTLTLAGATFVDADPSGSYTALINWGDGTSSMGVIAVDTDPGAAANTFTISGTHVYGDASPVGAPFNASVVVTDTNGGSMSTPPTAFTVTVNDVALTFTTTLPPVTVGQGATLSLPTIGFSDPTFAEATIPYTPSFTYTINWGDGNTDTGTANIDQAGSAGTPTLGDFTGSHVYTAPGAYTVKVTINDNEGAANSTTSQTFVATVVVPVVQAVPTQTVDEGSTLTLAGATFVDADPSGAYTALINWGDGSSSMGVIAVDTEPGRRPTRSRSAARTSMAMPVQSAAPFNASVVVTDTNGGSMSTPPTAFTVTVNDVAPTFTTTLPPVTVGQGAQP